MNIRFIQPYDFDLQIGHAINKAVAPLPDDSWIVHCDHDTLKPPGFAERVKKVLEGGVNERVVLTCMTNRVGKPSNAIVSEMYTEDSITTHLEVARELWLHHGTKIEPIKVAPGYCMIFHKMHWLSLGGFPASSIHFDKWLSERSTPYLMKGLYLIHLYRWGRENARSKYDHLLRPGYWLD